MILAHENGSAKPYAVPLLRKTLAPPTHASSTSMDYLRERYQAADKSRRYCSDSNTKNTPGRVRHDGNARVCMQCAAKANSMESARQSDGMRRKCSQIEYFSLKFSVQVVRCSGASVEEGVHMHQADYHVKKSGKCSEQRRLLITSSSLPGARYLHSFFRTKMNPAENLSSRVTRFLELPSDTPEVRYTSRARPLSIREAPADGLSQ